MHSIKHMNACALPTNGLGKSSFKHKTHTCYTHLHCVHRYVHPPMDLEKAASNIRESSKHSGNKKFSRAQSSCRSFWRGVPVMSSLPAPRSFRTWICVFVCVYQVRISPNRVAVMSSRPRPCSLRICKVFMLACACVYVRVYAQYLLVLGVRFCLQPQAR
jgi:hypothetical protein